MSGQRRILGRSVARLEDLPLLRGQGNFVADIAFPHELHMRIVRAPYAHGELRSVDVTAACAAPGVAAVWSGADIADLPPIDFRDPAGEALRPYRQPLLAQKRVRYVGEPVAAVFAVDACRAADAAELVSLTVEELAPVLDAAAAPGSFAPGLSTEATVLRAEYGNPAGAFAKAHTVVELDLTIGRHSAVPLETRGAQHVRTSVAVSPGTHCSSSSTALRGATIAAISLSPIPRQWLLGTVPQRRRDAQVAERVIIALPKELRLQQNVWALQVSYSRFHAAGKTESCRSPSTAEACTSICVSSPSLITGALAPANSPGISTVFFCFSK